MNALQFNSNARTIACLITILALNGCTLNVNIRNDAHSPPPAAPEPAPAAPVLPTPDFTEPPEESTEPGFEGFPSSKVPSLQRASFIPPFA